MSSNPSDDFVNGQDGSVKNGDSFESVKRNGDLGLVVGGNEDLTDRNLEGDNDRDKEEEFVSCDSMEKGDVSVEDESVKKDDSLVEDVETNKNEERNGDLEMGNEMGISVPEEKEVVQRSKLEEDQNRDRNEKFVSGDSLFKRGDCPVETNGSLGLLTCETEPSYFDEESQKMEVEKQERLGNEEKSYMVESDQRIHYYFLLQENDKTGFSLNDLVWGKVKSHPWWSGQIFNPKYASEMALKCQKKDCFLVAYFGDNTFAWVFKSQLKPLQAYFSTMEKQSSMVPFVNAVNAILEEVTRQVELGMACPCLGDETHDDLKYQKLENAGIQNGTYRAVVDRSVFVNAFRPKSILEYVRALAQCPFGEFDRLELRIATAQLKAFYRSNGCPELPVFVYGGGLVENDAEISLINTKMSGKGEADSSTIVASSIKTEKIPRGRRPKNHLSVDDDKLNRLSEKEKVASSISSGKRPRGRPRKNTIYEDRSEQENQFEHMEEDVDKSGYKVKSVARASSKKRRVADSDSADFARSKKERHGKEVDLDTEPPSSTPVRSFKVGDRINRAASQLQNNEMLSQLCLLARDPMQAYDFLPMIIGFFTKFKDSHSSGYSEVHELVKSMGRKGGRKRKVVSFEDASSEMSEPDSMQDSYWSDIILQNSPEKEPVWKGQKRKGGSQKKGQNKKTKPNEKQKAEGRRIVSGLEEIKEETPTALILSFSESDALPSADDLIKIFSPYGPLREVETKILKNTGRAKVIFRYRDDAEKAFSSAGKYSIFGHALVSYRLRYSPLPKSSPVNSSEKNDDVPIQDGNLEPQDQESTVVANDNT